VLGVVLAFFTGGASLVAEAANVAEKQAAIFKLILQEIVSTATMGVVDILRLFKVLIAKFAQACKNGWAGFKNFLEKILANKVDDVLKEEKFFDDYIKLSNELVEATKSKILLQKTNNLDELYDEAKVANKELKITTNNFATETNGKAGFRDGLKSKERALEKINADYAGDASRLVDIAGSKVVYETVDDLYIALSKFNKEYKILKIKDRIQKPMISGYRDVLINIEMKNGHIVEFRLHLKEMDVAAETGHKIYEQRRTLEAISTQRELTISELKKKYELIQKEKNLYDNAWKKITKK
jgi:Region found in RelA / SpoT proteins